MNDEIDFHPSAAVEWRKLDPELQRLFSVQLDRRIYGIHPPSARLRSPASDCFKIKLLSSGYRLIYQVREDQTLFVLIVGHRFDVYKNLIRRISKFF